MPGSLDGEPGTFFVWMEDGGWRMEDGGWRMEDGGWRMEDGGWRMKDEEDWTWRRFPTARPPRNLRQMNLGMAVGNRRHG